MSRVRVRVRQQLILSPPLVYLSPNKLSRSEARLSL